MATRSPSNRGLNVPPPARNFNDNTQAVRRIPGMDYGEQKALTEQQQAAPLPKDTLPTAPGRPAQAMPEIDVFHLQHDQQNQLHQDYLLDQD